MSRTNEIRLTFGLEVEINATVTARQMITLLTNYNYGPSKEREALAYHLADQLRCAGLEVHGENCVWTRHSKDSSRWSVNVSNVGIDEDRNWQSSLTLKSRVLELDDQKCVLAPHCLNHDEIKGGIAEVRQALEVLNRSSVKCVAKKGSGLRVHIGKGRSQDKTPASEALSFSALRNISCLAIAFEPCIGSMLGTQKSDCNNFRPLSTTFELASTSNPIMERLAAIQNVATVGELFDLMKLNRSINFSHAAANSTCITIGFRQHKATLNADAASNWIQFLAGLVHLAHRSRIETRLFEHAFDVEKGNLTYKDLLQLVGKSHLIANYGSRKQTSRRGPSHNMVKPPTLEWDNLSIASGSSGSVMPALPRTESRAKKMLRALSGRRREDDDGLESKAASGQSVGCSRAASGVLRQLGSRRGKPSRATAEEVRDQRIWGERRLNLE